jgi:hypothetical protein
MSRMPRPLGIAAAVAVIGVLLLPASGAVAGDGPVAKKSGTLINFITTGKLKVAKTIQPLAACTSACTVTGTGVIKGLGAKGTFADSGGPFQPGRAFGLALIAKGDLLKALKAFPGRFHLTETLTATAVDPTTGAPTGATESVTAGFKFKL